MRILIFEPTILKQESLRRLQDVGWGLCRVPRFDFQYTGNPVYSESFGKLFIWNMTQYDVALWLDADTLVLRSLAPLMELASRLPMPAISEKGLR